MHTPSPETLKTVNVLLSGADPEGAYCLGVVCALAWEAGTEPPNELLQAAVRLDRVKNAVDLYLAMRPPANVAGLCDVIRTAFPREIEKP